jgi:hypothetical protein
MMTRMQANLQSSLQATLESSLEQRQKDFQTRMEALLIGITERANVYPSPAGEPSISSLPHAPADICPQAPES